MNDHIIAHRNNTAGNLRSRTGQRSRKRRLFGEFLERRNLLAGDVGFGPELPPIPNAPVPPLVSAAEGDDIVEIRLQTTDLTGNPVAQVTQGETFLLQAFVEDVRPDALGVFASYVDVSYNSTVVSVAGAISYGPNYPIGQQGDASVPGLIDEVGAVDGISPLGPGEFLLFSVPMTADLPGFASFTSDPADLPGNETLVFGLDVPVTNDQIDFGSTNLLVLGGQSDEIVEIRLQTTDLTGNPISQVAQDETFLLQAFVEDLRPEALGVFASYMDVLYDSSFVSVAGPISYGSEYPNLQEGDTSVPGLIDEVGAVDGVSPLGPGEFLLFSVPMAADAPGSALFTSDPADVPGNETLVFGLDVPVTNDQIDFGSANLLILGAQGDDIVEIRLQTTDLSGNPIPQVAQGETFLLQAFVEDIRPDALGVFASYMDIFYDSPFVSVAGPISYGPNYPNLQEGDTSVPGLIDEVGAVDGFIPLGPGEFLLFSVPMIADEPGLASFTSDPADLSGNETLVFGLDVAVPNDQIDFGSTNLLILGAPSDDIVEIRLQTTDLTGNPIPQVAEGETFLLQAFVEDIRPDALGVFAAYMDVFYDSPFVSVAGPISYGSEYPNLQQGDASSPGVIDEVGAVDGISPLGPGEFLLFSVPMTADAPGIASFTSDPADVPGNETLVFGLDVPVTNDQIDFGSTVIEVRSSTPPEIVHIVSSGSLDQDKGEGDRVLVLSRFLDDNQGVATAVIDWGDGTPAETVPVLPDPEGGFVAAGHVYESGGIYTATLTVTDDSGLSDTATTLSIITGVGIMDGQLQVIGTAARDQVDVRLVRTTDNGSDAQNRVQPSERLQVRANFLNSQGMIGTRDFDPDSVDSILVVLREGNDRARIQRNIEIDAILDGGAGNDYLKGGGGNDILVGGDGRDLLFGRRGRDLLIGDEGRDWLHGGSNADLVSGNVYDAVADDNDDALADLLTDIDTLEEIRRAWVAGDRALSVELLEDGLSDDGDRDLLLRSRGDDQLLAIAPDRIF